MKIVGSLETQTQCIQCFCLKMHQKRKQLVYECVLTFSNMPTMKPANHSDQSQMCEVVGNGTCLDPESFHIKITSRPFKYILDM